MARDVLIHKDTNTGTNAGIVNAAYVTLGLFPGVNDPLANDNNTALAQKAGASIPNMFARMLFFSTAFESATDYFAATTYNGMISQCLDLLEMLYNGADGIEKVEYNIQGQIAALRESEMAQHHELADNIEQQVSILGTNVVTLYLFEKVDKDDYGNERRTVIGGTSPYTIVFTSPNFNTQKPQKPLLDRESGFKKYVYDMVSAMTKIRPYNNMPYAGFFKYVSECAIMDGRDLSTDGYTMKKYNNEYTQAVTHNRMPIVWCDINEVRMRPRASFSSDFYIQSTTDIPFSAQNTPLVLHEGTHNGMYYYGKQLWQPHYRIPASIERVSPGPRPLPECTAYTHDYVTDIDFFEEKLVVVDYPIDTDHFVGPILPLSKERYALLPLKPLYLQYFKKDDLKNNFMYEINDGNCEISLKVPVWDGGMRKNILTFERKYNLSTDVFDLSAIGQFGVGISPFYEKAGKYWVAGMIDAGDFKIELKYYHHGNIETQPTIQSSGSGMCVMDELPDFDFVRIIISDQDNNPQGRCLLLPKFDTVKDGKLEYAYAVDFGTTNTHIAYYADDKNWKDLASSDFESIARYFGKMEWMDQGVPQSADDKLRVKKARMFFPQTTSKLIYNFPIRTALFSDSNNWHKIFIDASIGFHYSKEILGNSSYDTTIKWGYLNNVLDNTAQAKAKTFMREILWMIKCHWYSNNEASHTNMPKICITYPKDASILADWKNAYQEIFNLPDITSVPLVGMVESLAPCVTKLANKKELRTQGFVGIDIGGGTTDMLYYKENSGNDKNSYYSSILFAADDLWGCCYENIGDPTLIPHDKGNFFTELAKDKFKKSNTKILVDDLMDMNTKDAGTTIEEIGKEGKELIDVLFKDKYNNFTRMLSKANGDHDVMHCRMKLLIHYSAIIYHMASWLQSIGADVPSEIGISGMGSKYLGMLFQDNQTLTQYTKQLLSKIFGESIEGRVVTVQMQEGNPKVVTARGAARDARINYELQAPQLKMHLGLANNPQKTLTIKEACGEEDNAMAFFKKFVDVFRSLDRNYFPTDLDFLTDTDANTLETNARTSIETILNSNNRRGNKDNLMTESMFVWALKDSIWKL